MVESAARAWWHSICSHYDISRLFPGLIPIIRARVLYAYACPRGKRARLRLCNLHSRVYRYSSSVFIPSACSLRIVTGLCRDVLSTTRKFVRTSRMYRTTTSDSFRRDCHASILFAERASLWLSERINEKSNLDVNILQDRLCVKYFIRLLSNVFNAYIDHY